MVKLTPTQEVEELHGHLRGTPRETFLFGLLGVAKEMEHLEAFRLKPEPGPEGTTWTPTQEIEARLGHLRGTPREKVLTNGLEIATGMELRAASEKPAEREGHHWTAVEEVTSNYGHMVGTPDEPFYLKLQGSAMLADCLANPVEGGFLTLADDWKQEALGAGQDGQLSLKADHAGLACLLIVKECGSSLGSASKQAIAANMKIRTGLHALICCDSLVWRLCECGLQPSPSKSQAVQSLISLMEHHNSSLRRWAMEMGWVVRDWLPPRKAIKPLLKNLADTLGAVDEAAGLAASLFDSEDRFFMAAAAFNPPSEFKDQYDKRIAHLRKYGMVWHKMHFLNRELKRRELILERRPS